MKTAIADACELRRAPIPSAETVPQACEAEITPSENTIAGRRPEFIAVAMIAKLAGPGLAAPTK